MNHDYEKEIICPYCNYEHEDSWEFGDDSGTWYCGECGKEFNVERNIEITYSSSKINCDDTNESHDYVFEEKIIFKSKYKGSIGFEDIPEHEWRHTIIEVCSKCDDKKYNTVTKEEYFNYEIK